MKKYLKLLRIHHYIKNLLVFAALACSGQMFSSGKLLSCLAGFAAFCAVSSTVYIVNDIRDAEKDRLHPVKCLRPIASGAVSVRTAVILAVILTVTAFICNALVFRLLSTILLAVYLLMNLGYSFGLKDIPLVDITILVAGFGLRLYYGALICDIPISNWLFMTMITLSFFFALGKRRNELKRSGDGDTRRVLKRYPIGFLDKNMYMCLGLANGFYALWAIDERTATHYSSDYLIFTVPIVLLITLKYSLDIEGDSDGDPVEVLLHDRALLALCALYIAVMFLILYL